MNQNDGMFMLNEMKVFMYNSYANNTRVQLSIAVL